MAVLETMLACPQMVVLATLVSSALACPARPPA
jgi:hypothetical protein